MLSIYLNKQVVATFFLGIASGIPLALTSSTLGAWLSQAGISKSVIGLFAIVGIPYSLKFLWAPAIDNISIPFLERKLGKRRSWLIMCQIFLAIAIISLGNSNPLQNIKTMAILCIIVSFFAATQDIIIDAYRINLIPDTSKQGAAVSTTIVGYRIGNLISGGGMLLIVDFFQNLNDASNLFYNWSVAYYIISLTPIIGTLAALFVGEPESTFKLDKKSEKNSILRSIKLCTVEPFLDFINRYKSSWMLLLLFCIIYRSCDAFIATMVMPFFIELGFSLTEIGIVVKSFGFGATIFGGLIGTFIIRKCKGCIKKALIVAGIGQMLSNVMFVIQAYAGNSITCLYVTVASENICSGVASCIFVVFLSGLCKSQQHVATQYSLLTALATIDKVVISSVAGWMAQELGWITMFSCSVLLGVPPMIILYYTNVRNIK